MKRLSLPKQTPEEIAKDADGPAAKALAYEGWVAAESYHAGELLSYVGVRERFEDWWAKR